MSPLRSIFRRDILIPLVGVLLSLASLWVFAGPRTEIDRTRRQFVELQRQIQIEREKRQSQTNTGDATAAVRRAVLAVPLVPLPGATRTSDVVAIHAPNSNGCAACHLAVATAGYEVFPVPFRTHSNLAAYVGAESPHPPSRVECVSCHQGDGHATSFGEARHTRLGSTVFAADSRGPAPRDTSGDRTDRAGSREWADLAVKGAILPTGRTEAACGTCHEGERYQPVAVELADAWTTLERGGCYGCHVLPGSERSRKQGPDLRRIGGKLSPAWVRTWLSNPRAVKPTTWMPRFWTGDVPSAVDAAAIDAVGAYLFESSEPYAPVMSNPPRGDGARGQHLFDSIGCTGCHVLGDTSRERVSLRRTFGPSLQGVGSKDSYAWLFDWLRDPSRYSPNTRMPNLRLTAAESSDIASYLAASGVADARAPGVASTPPESNDLPVASDEQYRAVYRRYAGPGDGTNAPSILDAQQLGQLTGRPLRTQAGRVVIERLQCAGCHAIRGFESYRAQRPIPPRSVWLDADVRAIHTRPNSGATTEQSALTGPDLNLSDNEGARLALALTAVAGSLPSTHAMSMPWHIAKVAGRALMQERNCVGCHSVDGIGGDFAALAGDRAQGVSLPSPDASHLQVDWLRGFLRDPKPIRPGLDVRMPAFTLTDDEVSVISRYLQAIAPPTPTPPAR